MAKTETVHCSFCGRNRDEVKILIAGTDGHICENCIEHAHEIIQTLIKLKPTAAKGTYIKSIHLSSTMSPGIALDPKAV